MNFDFFEESRPAVKDKIGQLSKVDKFRVVLESGVKMELSEKGLIICDNDGYALFEIWTPKFHQAKPAHGGFTVSEAEAPSPCGWGKPSQQ